MVAEGTQEQVEYLEGVICEPSPKTAAAAARPVNSVRPRNAPTVLVDGSNMAYVGGDSPKLSDLVRVMDTLEHLGLTVLTLVDASLRHQIDDKRGLEEMIRDRRIVQVPARRSADDFLTQLAKRIRARGNAVCILTNDVFPETNGEDPLPRIACVVVSLGGEEEVVFSPPPTSITEGPSIETTPSVPHTDPR